MTIWDPFSALARVDTDFDRTFDQLVRRTFGGRAGAAASAAAGFVPAVDMTREGADVVIRLELPGVDIDDVDIEVADGRLTVTGRRTDQHVMRSDDDDRQVLVREQRYGAFRRDFALPEGVDADAVDAAYDKGILELRVRGVVPQPSKPRKVEVRSSGTATTKAVGQGHGDDVVQGQEG
ncbi:MAG TPA: Hsp20/alpha crystallin family protein [Jiangellales bacterium]|nr:Hsp20/alpha crystallin family protein [Jiangellales bacterium]